MSDTAATPAETVESLQAALEQEQAAHAVTKDLYEQEVSSKAILQAERDKALAETEQLRSDLAEAKDVIAGQQETIAKQDALIETLQTKPLEFPTILVDKKTYEVRAKSFQYQKTTYTVGDLLKNKPLQKELVKKGVGFLVEKEA